jgi:hypothetical protein
MALPAKTHPARATRHRRTRFAQQQPTTRRRCSLGGYASPRPASEASCLPQHTTPKLWRGRTPSMWIVRLGTRLISTLASASTASPSPFFSIESPSPFFSIGSAANHLDGNRELLLANLVVLLLLVRRPQPLPGQASPKEVEEYVPQRFEVVPAPLKMQHGVTS